MKQLSPHAGSVVFAVSSTARNIAIIAEAIGCGSSKQRRRSRCVM